MESEKNRKYNHINAEERKVIERLLRQNTPKKQIARLLNRSITTIRKEIKRGSVEQRTEIKTTKKDINVPLYTSQNVYFADLAQQDYERNRENCGCKCKIVQCQEFVTFVERLVKEQKWSLDAAAGYAKVHGLYQNTCSTQTLYNWVDLGLCKIKNIDLLKKTRRKTHSVKVRQHKKLYGRSIEERPAKVDLRQEFGHWEGDGIVGKNQQGHLISLVERKTGIIDRCTEIVLRDYVRNGYQGEAPTLLDFYNCLLEQPEPQAQELALGIEIYAKGSLATFAKQTNIDINNRIICFDIHELSEHLMSIGMLVLFDHIQNRMVKNRMKGVSTSIINDEFYLMFQHNYTSEFFYKMWKRGRKYGADYCGITQNVEDLLRNANGRAIMSTSELIIMLNQAPLDREQLAELLHISENQQEYIKNAKPGSGLIKIGGDLIPFENDIPQWSSIYKLLTTKPDEAIYALQE